jgi:hypothetical protein
MVFVDEVVPSSCLFGGCMALFMALDKFIVDFARDPFMTDALTAFLKELLDFSFDAVLRACILGSTFCRNCCRCTLIDYHTCKSQKKKRDAQHEMKQTCWLTFFRFPVFLVCTFLSFADDGTVFTTCNRHQYSSDFF